jgi:hypothetical protein
MMFWKQKFNQITDCWRLGDMARAEWRKNGGAAIYLWVKPASGGAWGDVLIAAEKPNGEYMLAMNERINPAWPFDSIRARLEPIICRLPICGD